MARKKPAPIINEVETGAWMMTFSDLLTLLLAFFVLLLTMSSMDDRKFRDAFGAFSGAFGTLAKQQESGLSPDFIVPIKAPVPEILVSDVDDLLDRHLRDKSEKPVEPPEIEPEPEQYKHLFESERVPEGLVIRIAGRVLFDPDSAQLARPAVDLLQAVATELAEVEVPVRVQCYVPPRDDERDAAWALALDRAAAVAQIMARVRGVNRKHLSLMGYGRPIPKTIRINSGQDVVVLTFFSNQRTAKETPEGSTGSGEE